MASSRSSAGVLIKKRLRRTRRSQAHHRATSNQTSGDPDAAKRLRANGWDSKDVNGTINWCRGEGLRCWWYAGSFWNRYADSRVLFGRLPRHRNTISETTPWSFPLLGG